MCWRPQTFDILNKWGHSSVILIVFVFSEDIIRGEALVSEASQAGRLPFLLLSNLKKENNLS